MRNGISTMILFLVATIGYTQNATVKYLTAYSTPTNNDSVRNDNKQNFYYEIHSTLSPKVKNGVLVKATKLSELSEGYPTNWLNEYVSTEIRAKSNGKIISAKGANESLSSDQRNLLAMADIGAEVEISIKYRTKNSATDKSTVRDMTYGVTVVPDVEAQFAGGPKGMKKYMWDNAVSKFQDVSSKEIGDGSVRFTVNESGETIDVQIKKSSGDPKIDRLIIDAIDKMPKWKPAENSTGKKVRQDFEFTMGTSGC